MKNSPSTPELRLLTIAWAAALLSLSSATGALAQPAAAYPSKPVRVVIPFGPGSSTDVVARTVMDEFRTELGESFLVENREGANGFIAAEMVARAAPNGYTLFITSTTTHSTNQSLFKKLPYDPVKDFTAIGGIMESYYVLLVPNELPVNSVSELVNWMKANPDKASYGWGATVGQITGASFLRLAGAKATGVAYKSSPQTVTDLIGGRLTFMFDGVTTGLAHIKAGRVKGLAVSAPVRIPALPNVPTATEANVPGFDAVSYVGMFGPAGMPEPIVARLNGTLQNILKKQALVQKMDSCCSARLFLSTPAGFDEYLRRDRTAWAQKISAAGIEPQ